MYASVCIHMFIYVLGHCPVESAHYSLPLKETKNCFSSSLCFMQKKASIQGSSFCRVPADTWRFGFTDCIDILHQPLQLGLLKISLEIIQLGKTSNCIEGCYLFLQVWIADKFHPSFCLSNMHRVLCVMLISIWMLMSPRQLCDSHFRLGGMVCLLKWKKNLRKQAIAMARIIAVLLRVAVLDLSTFQLSFAVLQAVTFQWSPYPAPV